MKRQSQRERLKKRNQAVMKTYAELDKKHPQWRYDAIIEKVADRFFLAPKTVDQIIRGDYEKHLWKDEKEGE